MIQQDYVTYTILLIAVVIALYQFIGFVAGTKKQKLDLKKNHCSSCSLRELHKTEFRV